MNPTPTAPGKSGSVIWLKSGEIVSVTPVAVAVALAEMTNVVASVMLEIVAPDGMPEPDTGRPTQSCDVSAVVMFGLPLVVLQDSSSSVSL